MIYITYIYIHIYDIHNIYIYIYIHIYIKYNVHNILHILYCRLEMFYFARDTTYFHISYCGMPKLEKHSIFEVATIYEYDT